MQDTVQPRHVPEPIVLSREPDIDLELLIVRPTAREVAYGQTVHALEPRVMQVLVALAQQPGTIVSRDELIDRCWEGRIVGDDAITRCISALRKLAQNCDDAFEIETLSKVGYKLKLRRDGRVLPPAITASSPISSTQVEFGAPPTPRVTSPPSRSPPTRLLPPMSKVSTWLAAGLTLFGLGIVAAFGLWPGGDNGARAEAVRLTQAAHALLRERNPASTKRADHLLKEAVATDPSYALAWSELGLATYLPWWWEAQTDPDARQRLKAEAIADIKRAIALDPKLARAYAIMGMVLTDSGEGLPWLQRAVALDQADPEIWMWLGNARGDDLRGALEAYERARAIDPAWHRLDGTYLALLFRLRGPEEAYQALDKIALSMNDQNWPLQKRADLKFLEGRLAESAALAVSALRSHPQNRYWALNTLMMVGLTVGDMNLANRALAVEPLLRTNFSAFGPDGMAFERAQSSPETWWDGTMLGAQASQLVTQGRAPLLVHLYDIRFSSPAEFLARCTCDTVAVGPAIVVGLRKVARLAEADQILAGIDRQVARIEASRDLLIGTKVNRARIAALQGRPESSIQSLNEAVREGWIGQDPDTGGDPAFDPAFESLRSNASFRPVLESMKKARTAEAARLAKLDLNGPL